MLSMIRGCMATTVQAAPGHSQHDSPEPAPAKWRTAGKALILALGLRIFYSLLAACLSPRLGLEEKIIHSNRLTDHLINRAAHPVLYASLGVWERFDTLWYVQISRHGYEGPIASVFYPLYPILIRIASFLTHSDLVAALSISTAASFLFFWGALRLFELDTTPATAWRGLLLWAVWPAAFTFFAGYPESLLCALIVWVIYFARSDRWLTSGTLGLLAGLTKAVGCLTALPLLWFAWRRRSRMGLLAAVMCGAGTACFQGWLAVRHFPAAAQVYRTYWATVTVAPWATVLDTIRSLAHSPNFMLIVNVAVLAIVCAAAMMPSVRVEYRIFTVGAVSLFLTKHSAVLLESSTRYALAAFPAYLQMAVKVRGLGFAVLLLLAGALNLLLFRAFLDWGLVV